MKKRHKLPVYLPHMDIAFPSTDLERFRRTLSSDKLAWLVAPWDVDGEMFLACTENLGIVSKTLYRIDCCNYANYSSFLEALQNDLGISADILCHALTGEQEVALLFDHIQAEKYPSGLSVFSEARNFSERLSNRCPNVHIVFKTTHDMANAGLDPVVLRAMDEVDTGRYVLSHPSGFRVSEVELSGGEIYLITKGSSVVTDRLLARLEYMSLLDFGGVNSDSFLNNVFPDELPSVLKAQVDRLQKLSSDFTFDLLKCLTVFPFGEDISNLKYFDRDKAFYPRTGGPLVKQGLAEGLRFFIFRNEPAELPKVIVARTMVQEYIRSKLSTQELNDLTLKALNLYFGSDWTLGRPKLNSSFNLENSNYSTYSIRNANALLRRVFNDAIELGEARKTQDCLGLLSYYVRRLVSAHQYRYVVSLCYMLHSSLAKMRDDHFVKEILFAYGKSLRMIREYDKSVLVMDDLLTAKVLTVEFKSKVYVDIALNYDEQGHQSSAVEAAKKALMYREQGSSYFHAQTVIICLTWKGDKEKKLKELRTKSKNKRCFAAANTISMRLQHLYGEKDRARDVYKEIADTAKKTGDIYNFIRATIRSAEQAVRKGVALSDKEMTNLFFAYHVVYSQRLMGLFKAGHMALWFEYERLGEALMLVSLFKQGSLLFRLSADEDSERLYLSRLIDNHIIPATVLLSVLAVDDRNFLIERLRVLRMGRTESVDGVISIVREPGHLLEHESRGIT
ncbi:hypothetical protein K5D34_04580 [Pseudomonas cichorii]|nr:hypothetical protein [Pseudomonas cichorii]MBX8508969.1 hypothetical protein [Pseudomonas cichorii]MBX8524532.1 hypothetical protein [Pseudomonas cichorii]